MASLHGRAGYACAHALVRVIGIVQLEMGERLGEQWASGMRARTVPMLTQMPSGCSRPCVGFRRGLMSRPGLPKRMVASNMLYSGLLGCAGFAPFRMVTCTLPRSLASTSCLLLWLCVCLFVKQRFLLFSWANLRLPYGFMAAVSSPCGLRVRSDADKYLPAVQQDFPQQVQPCPASILWCRCSFVCRHSQGRVDPCLYIAR